MAQWVRICGVNEAPPEGAVNEQRAGNLEICLARVDGELRALDNLCPHRQGPLGQGWIEGKTVVCPWHSWAFDVKTGFADYPEGEKVGVFSVRVEGDDVLVEIE
jgi:nitrite reductase (NADH) small subunit